MKHLIVLALLVASPVCAQRRVDFIIDAEGVRRSSATRFEPNVVRFDPRFDTGGGAGAGMNFFLTDRVSIEAKAAALVSHLRIRTQGSDFISVADLGRAQIYPITALLQWHMLEHGAVRPYIGAGAGHVIVRNIGKSGTGVRFHDPTGLVLDGGIEIALSRRWSIVGDARYTPIESRASVTFTGTASSAEIDVKPLVVSTGIAFRF